MSALIIGRVICGVGGGGLYTGVMVLLSVNTTEQERPSYFGKPFSATDAAPCAINVLQASQGSPGARAPVSVPSSEVLSLTHQQPGGGPSTSTSASGLPALPSISFSSLVRTQPPEPLSKPVSPGSIFSARS